MKTKRKSISPLPVLVAIAAVLFVTILIFDKPQQEPEPETESVQLPETTAPTVPAAPYTSPETPREKLETFARMHDLSLDTWPEDLVALLERNPDAENFVFNYPFLKGTQQEADLSDLVGTGEVPKLYQWDARWGYSQYGDKEMGLTGCGPTCLSMVCLYFLEDAKYTPRYVADFAEDNDYYTPGHGSNWTLMSEGAQALGLDVVTSYADSGWLLTNLEAGHLIILALEPSVFSPNGHFVLLAGQENGQVIVHDPNSNTNSEKLWEVESFLDEILNVWIFTKPEA